MAKVELRKHQAKNAKRLFEILSNPNFTYFTACPKSVKAEAEWLKECPNKSKINLEHNFAIFYDDKLVGGCGIKINQHRKHEGEIGYFLDEAYWGKGIVPKAVRKLEKIGFGKLQLKRIEILMNPKNKASEKVAKKCRYKKEGTMKKVIKSKENYWNAHLYAKVK
ncbi:MAG: GNAT family N-acetyltransferase [Candidatus Woesearchaeota archaeon]